MTVDPGKLLSTEQIKFKQTAPVVSQNGQNQLYFNPVAMAAFDSTVVTPTLFVGYEKLSEKEIIIHHIETLVDGAVRLRRTKNKRTGTCSFGPVLAEHPILRVSPDRKNLYRYRIDDLDDGTQRFVLLIEKPKVVPIEQRALKAAATRRKKTAAAKSSPGAALMEVGGGKAK